MRHPRLRGFALLLLTTVVAGLAIVSAVVLIAARVA